MGRQGRTDVFVITDAKDVAGRAVQAVGAFASWHERGRGNQCLAKLLLLFNMMNSFEKVSMCVLRLLTTITSSST